MGVRPGCAVFVAILLAGCSGASTGSGPDPTQPLHRADEAPPDEVAEEGHDCDVLRVPEAWYGHGDGSLWCVRQGGAGGASGSTVTPVTPLHDVYQAHNGSAGHPAGTPVEAHVVVACWSGACLADLTVTVFADGREVARLQKQEVVVDVILLGGVWVDLEGELSRAIPDGGVPSLEVEAGGVGPLMLLGVSGDRAPWFQIGT